MVDLTEGGYRGIHGRRKRIESDKIEPLNLACLTRQDFKILTMRVSVDLPALLLPAPPDS